MLEVLEQIRTDDKNPENQKAARDSVVKAAQTTVKTAQQNIAIQRAAANVAPDIINNLPARIYLQFQREMPRDQAEEIEMMLEAKGWNVPGIEAVNQVPSQNELRYFAGGATRTRISAEPGTFQPLASSIFSISSAWSRGISR